MIRILAVGKLKDRRLADLAGDYQRRIRPLATAEVIELKDQNPEKEARQMLDKLGSRDGSQHVVALDERGKSMASTELATLLGKHGSLTFIIGGADGLTDPVRQRADTVLRLSRMTFTHEMARVLLLEQVYRGLSILRGMPYHRR